MDKETVKNAICRTAVLLFCLPLPAQLQTNHDTTTFAHTVARVATAWQPAAALGAQAVLLSHADDTFLHRARSWQEKGFYVHLLLGVNQGNYQDYISGVWDGVPHEDWQLSDSREYFYPTKSFIAYLKSRITHAIDCGAEAIYLEHPTFLPGADSSASFKASTRENFKSPWQDPAGSVELRYHAGKFQQRLYWEAVVDIFAHAKQYAQEKNREIKCYVAMHSLLENARLGRVGPSTRLLHIPDCDGVLAEADGKALLAPTVYANVRAARPFETAFLHYGLFANQVRGHGKQLWLQLNPLVGDESSPEEIGKLYRAQIAAALFYPEHWRFELPPIPEALLAEARGKGVEWATPPGMAAPAPADSVHQPSSPAAAPRQISAHLMLTIHNTLKDMKQESLGYETAERGVGILVSDAMLLQRAAPAASDSLLSFFYSLALPLLKHGIFVQPLAMENLHQLHYLTGYKVLFLSYRFMKPQDYKWHERLTTWVRAGGTLIFIDDGGDPYNQVKDWWRKGMFDYTAPAEHLFETLKLGYWPKPGRNQVGMGSFIYLAEDPAAFAHTTNTAAQLLDLVNAALPAGRTIQTQNYLQLRRGPYLIAATFTEMPDLRDRVWHGHFVDLFDERLPHITQKTIASGEQALLFDLARLDSSHARVLAGSGIVAQTRHGKNSFTFSVTGPAGIRARVLTFVPTTSVNASAICAGKPLSLEMRNDGNLFWLEFENQPQGVEVRMVWEAATIEQKTSTK